MNKNQKPKKSLYIYICIATFWVCGSLAGRCQSYIESSKPPSSTNIKLFEAEVSIGKVFGNFTNYPERGLRKSLFLHKGQIRLDQKNLWPSYYNYPITGWTLGMAELGNTAELGYQYSIMPYVEFRKGRLATANWSLYIGLGANYFNRPFDIETNNNNKSVGGHYTWDLKVFIKRILYRSNKFNLKLGAGFLHASSGHVELPNFGLNSFGINLSGQFLNKPVDQAPFNYAKEKYREKNKFILQFSGGIGLQELGGSDRPIDGPKKIVYTSSIGLGLALNPHIRLHTGLRHRYYQAFYDYLTDNNSEILADHKYKNSTSYHIYIGGEFILGHIGIEGDIGFTLYRPFYDRYFELYKEENGYDHFVGEYLPTRLGLNMYLIKPEKMPRHNLSVGAHINANFSTADYSELSLKYYFQIEK